MKTSRPCSDPDQRVLIIADQHYPAINEQAHEELEILIEEYKPTKIVNLGDMFDNKEVSRWDAETVHITIMETGGKSLPETYKEGIELFDSLIDRAPKGCEAVYIFGNHEIRTRNVLAKFKHILDFHPLLHAIGNSRHYIQTCENFPNNDYVLLKDPLVLCSHRPSRTGQNHARATWNRDYALGASRIYGDLHNPQHYEGESEPRRNARDKRFAWGLGALCDRGHRYMDYMPMYVRQDWEPTVGLVEVSNGHAHFEEVALTPSPLTYEVPKMLGKGLHA